MEIKSQTRSQGQTLTLYQKCCTLKISMTIGLRLILYRAGLGEMLQWDGRRYKATSSPKGLINATFTNGNSGPEREVERY